MRELTGSSLTRLVLLGLFLTLLGTAVAAVLAPFVVSILWAGILGFSSWPLYVRLLRGLGGRAWPAALGMTLFMAAIVVLPTLWLLLLLRADVGQLADHLAAQLAAGRLRPPAFVDDLPVVGPDIAAWLNAVLAEPARLKTELKALFGRLDTEALALLGGVGRNLAKLVFALLTLFFVYLGGQSLAGQVRTILTGLLGERADGYIEAVASTTRAVVYGIVITALIQGAVAGLGYWVAGLPAPGTLTAVTVLLALIPFGTPLVWGTAALWLLFTGQTSGCWGACRFRHGGPVPRPGDPGGCPGGVAGIAGSEFLERAKKLASSAWRPTTAWPPAPAPQPVTPPALARRAQSASASPPDAVA